MGRMMGKMGKMGTMGKMGKLYRHSPIMPILPILPIIPPILPIPPIIPPIMPIPPIIMPIPPTIPFHPIHPRPIHLLLNTSILQEIPLLPLNQPTNQHITLMNQRNGYVRDGLIRALLNLLPINSRIQMRLTKRPCLLTTRVIKRPLLQTAHTQIVLIV